MTKIFNNIPIQLVPEQDFKISPEVFCGSLLLSNGFSLDHSMVVGEAVPGLRAGSGISPLFERIRPSKDGFTFELATALDTYLPRLDPNQAYLS